MIVGGALRRADRQIFTGNLADPRIWHFAFHNIPKLPTLLVEGHQRAYFDFFHDFLAGGSSDFDGPTRAD